MSSDLLRTSSVTTSQLRSDIPNFVVGSIIIVYYKIKEGEKERIQAFRGIVTNKHGGDTIDATFTVTKVTINNIKVERTFPLHSPNIDKVEVVELQRARRSNINELTITRKDYSKSGRFKTIKTKKVEA
jgi:large subunit ribosomal protein L19